MADKLKFALALVLVAAGVAGFYLLGEAALILRILSVLAGVFAGVAVAWFTEPGRRFLVFGQEAWTETKKAGVVLGWLAWRGRSFWPCFLLHAGVAVTMDVTALVNGLRFAGRW